MNRASIDFRLSRPEYVEHLRGWVSETIERTQPDIIFVRGIESYPALPPSYAGPLVVDFVDALSLLAEREAKMDQTQFGQFRHNREARALARFEQEVLQRCDKALFISEIDSRAVCARYPEKSLVISNGVDVSYYQPPSDASKNLPLRDCSAIFFGVQNYGPNADASHWIISDIAPKLKAQIPQVQVRIIGPGAEPRLLEASRAQDTVRIVGEVDDLRPELHRGGVFLCPLRFGAGMKNKILVALAAGLPVVATSVAVEGMGLEGAVRIADSAEALAESVCDILKAPNTGLNHEAARVLQTYSWASRGGEVLTMIHDLLRKGGERTQNPAFERSARG